MPTYCHSRAVRLSDFDYASDADIHVTICADHGEPFRRADLARLVCDSVERCSELCRYRLYGFTLMPDHLHLLCSPGSSGIVLAVWLRRFKSFTTNEQVKLGRDAPLWQVSGNDHVCRAEETAETILTYIINNPVRAGLVERWQDWPWTRVFIEL